MSSSSIHLKTINGPARLRLLDHQMKPLATGYGELEQTDLEAGLYMVEIDAGSHHEERIISVKPGERYSDLKMEVEFPSAVPMGGTSTSHEYHSYPAQELSRKPNLKLGTGGRLMIFVRHVEKEEDSAGSVASRGQAIDFGALTLLDQRLEPVVPGGLTAHDAGEATDGWAGICADLDPGGYALECPLNEEPVSRSLGEQQRVQQSVWVAEGWTTLVFLPCLAGQSLPSLDLASIHMTRVYAGFQPYEDEALQVNLAAEMATHGFRTGERMLPADLLNLLLHTKFQNPMLGVLGAHVLLQSKEPNWKLFDTVVKNLKKMIGEAPDCVALEVLGRERRDSQGGSPLAVSWPPMLAAGYRGLITWDADHPGLVEPDSVADHAAAGLHTSWPWSRWGRLAPWEDANSTSATPGRGDGKKGLSASGRLDEEAEDIFEFMTSASKYAFSVKSKPSKGFRLSDEEEASSSPRQKARELVSEWLKTADVESRPLTRGSIESPEVEQVSGYLARMAEQTAYGRADISKMDLRQLSKRVGLPFSTVRRAVSKLKE